MSASKHRSTKPQTRLRDRTPGRGTRTPRPSQAVVCHDGRRHGVDTASQAESSRLPADQHVHPAVWVDSSYENIRAECPWCRRESIFNRRSDLNGAVAIANKTVECLREDCGKRFVIIGDSANESFEVLVYDAYELIDAKRYIATILTLAQAHEVFFSTWLRVFLAYRPYAHDIEQGLGQLNARLGDLFEATKKLTFGPLRAVFLRLVLRNSPSSLRDSSRVIAEIPNLVGDPSDRVVDTCDDPGLRVLLHKLKSSTIHDLRNRVVHQRAYRPSGIEAFNLLEATRETLFGLAARLDVHDDPNWYLSQRAEG